MADKLPVSVLLGTDVPELGSLLCINTANAEEGAEDALVTTRAQAAAAAQAEIEEQQKQEHSGAQPHRLETGGEMEPIPAEGQQGSPFDTLDDDLFNIPATQTPPTRHEKRRVCHEHGLVRAKDRPQLQPSKYLSLELDKEKIKQLQESDGTLDQVRELAKDPEQPFFVEDGLLYRKWEPRAWQGQDASEAVFQLILPKDCRPLALKLAHSVPLSGHLGRKKTMARLSPRFYWPSMHKDVASSCQCCETCQRFRKRKPSRVPLIPLPVVAEPFSRVAMDVVGPLPRSRSGNKYVLVLCDYATRYPEAVPLRNVEAETVAEELVKVFARVGIPQEMLTDQGSNFQSQLLQELYHLLHVDAIRTSPYHPQTDGLVERFNQTLKSMLRKSASEDGKDWDKMISFLLFAYREVPQESTGFSPFELLYGRDVRGPLDILKETWVTSKRSNQNILSYVLLMREKLTAMSQLAQENLKTAAARQKRWYDHNARERSFVAGDKVLVLLPTSASKLTAQWQGPYHVVRPVGKVNYLVEMSDKKKRRVLHVNMLQKWHTPAPSVLLAQEVAEEMDSDELPSWNEPSEGNAKVGGQLSSEQLRELSMLLDKFEDMFQALPGHTTLSKHRIITEEVAPVRLPPYRIPHALRENVHQELREMLDHGIIEQSTSNWAFPLVTVRKKDSSLRLCVDYRRLNSMSKADAYPMPRVDELIDRVAGAPYISTLDLTKGYWQVPVAQEDREKTAFTTPYGLFQFKRMPFGLQGAPATFQRMVDRLLDGCGKFSGAYLDDVIIFSETWSDHVKHLETVLGRIRAAGLTLKKRKCQFGMPDCVYLGHRIGSGRVCPEEVKVQAIKSFTQPTTKRQVRSFLGITGYYRKKSLSRTMHP